MGISQDTRIGSWQSDAIVCFQADATILALPNRQEANANTLNAYKSFRCPRIVDGSESFLIRWYQMHRDTEQYEWPVKEQIWLNSVSLV
jgi:hypothetical protein